MAARSWTSPTLKAPAPPRRMMNGRRRLSACRAWPWHGGAIRRTSSTPRDCGPGTPSWCRRATAASHAAPGPLRRGGGLVDAPGRGLVGAKGKYPPLWARAWRSHGPAQVRGALRAHVCKPSESHGPLLLGNPQRDDRRPLVALLVHLAARAAAPGTRLSPIVKRLSALGATIPVHSSSQRVTSGQATCASIPRRETSRTCVPLVCQLGQTPPNSAQLSRGRDHAKGPRYPTSSHFRPTQPNSAKVQLASFVPGRSPVHSGGWLWESRG
jgi:hypothetical protein